MLHIACALGHIDHVKYLINHRADVNQINAAEDTVLMSACQDTCFKKVKYLVDIGCDIYRTNLESMTALHFAAAYSTVNIVAYLLSYVAHTFVRGSTGSNMLLLFDFHTTPSAHIDIPLHLACVFNPVDIAECLYNHLELELDTSQLFMQYLFPYCKENNSHRALFMTNKHASLSDLRELCYGEKKVFLVKHDTLH